MVDLNIKLKLTRLELNEYKLNLTLSLEQKEILLGGLLGDLNLRKIGNYSRLVVEQKNKEYLFHLYEIFKDYVRTEPKERLQKRLDTSEWKSTWYFSTISHPDFEYYYQMFYINNRKIVPINLEELLTPRAIAYWFMDDGSKNSLTYRLHSCSFTIEEHILLLKIFKDKFNIIALSHNLAKYNYIYITLKEDSNLRFKLLIEPYILSSMLYKL
jgi:hypothetical protein